MSYRYSRTLILISIGVLFLLSDIKAQRTLSNTNSHLNWSVNPFENKAFIKNEGQFNGKNGLATTPLYGVVNQGMEIYFTPNGLTYKHEKIQNLSKEEREKIEHANFEFYEEEDLAEKSVYIHLEWLGSNKEVNIIAENPVSWYHTYSQSENSFRAMKAFAYKKITYKNIYPNIDIEYLFPETHKYADGFKYNIILHPGSDASVIKMKYTHADGIAIDKDGNTVLSTPFGYITDHAPVVYYRNGGNIKSAFNLQDDIVSFYLEGRLDNEQDIIIDPWITIPTFTGYNKAYDVDYDSLGNAYVYGSYNPYELIKISSTGTILWKAATPFPAGGLKCYGDFALDRVSGSSYVGEGCCRGRAIKLNSAGMQTAFYNGNSNLTELWRMKYDNCTKKIIVAGGGTAANYQAGLLDTNLIYINTVNVLGATDCCHDMTLLSIDNSGNSFMATAVNSIGAPSFDNVFLKCPTSSLSPTSYILPNGHSFIEVSSITYVSAGPGEQTNGFNGMAVNDKHLYTYDGVLIEKRNKNTGSLITNKWNNGGNRFSHGGLAVDDCDNVFMGVNASIELYDSSLILLTTIPVTDTVYDIVLKSDYTLYVCGKNFVSTISLPDYGCVNTPACSIYSDSTCKDLFIPNAFSPNNDGENDIFYVRASCFKQFHLNIFNRWGERVFRSMDINYGWDGSYKNKNMNTEVFFYVLEGILHNGSDFTISGNVSLIR